jgi:hypothetical protein
MRVTLFSTAVLLLMLIAAGGTALACDCVTPPKPERFKRSDMIVLSFGALLTSILFMPQRGTKDSKSAEPF